MRAVGNCEAKDTSGKRIFRGRILLPGEMSFEISHFTMMAIMNPLTIEIETEGAGESGPSAERKALLFGELGKVGEEGGGWCGQTACFLEPSR